jgi:chromosome segregation ATPase
MFLTITPFVGMFVNVCCGIVFWLLSNKFSEFQNSFRTLMVIECFIVMGWIVIAARKKPKKERITYASVISIASLVSSGFICMIVRDVLFSEQQIIPIDTTEINKYKTENEKLQSQISTLTNQSQQEVNKYKTENEKLQSQISTLTTQSQQEIDKYKTENNTLKRTNTEKDQQILKLTTQSQQEIDKYKTENDILKQTNTEKELKISELNRKNQQNEQLQKTTNEQLSTMQTEKEGIQNKYDELLESEKVLMYKLNETEQRYKEVQKELDDSKEKDQKIQQLQQLTTELNKEIEELNNIIKEKTEQSQMDHFRKSPTKTEQKRKSRIQK